MAFLDLSKKPTGALKWFLKAPTYLFRAKLGFLFGKRFVMLEHRGRTSGNVYRTVIEVAGRNPEANEYICTSGTGPQADWYRNLQADGLDAVWVGNSRHADATVRFLDAEEASVFMSVYEREHPKTAAKLYDVMGVSYDGTDADRTRMMGEIPMVAFHVP
ncbi:deazaflavin-dependent oxidoreductase (nitroreductase family) [Ilumatobacter fluminis]|uniref:Deazaflavin-dependent oxidoreductase (Nitroreductase family) n=1 Tax=Ilumatobacter fluminis TaxID=467091 RepID=A0A4R7I2R6_9ACTN|nr:nitroreductase family deazaflavin-dependent oxidoreductase [Ilumatobacter fluminis]TDT17520.1 deazaflavin-dependent oxidoreductase (nitroreductase family) [Ilumatobacter fluminis]